MAAAAEYAAFVNAPDEQEVGVRRELPGEVLEAGVADDGDRVPRLFTPHRDGLRHDAREVGLHAVSYTHLTLPTIYSV